MRIVLTLVVAAFLTAVVLLAAHLGIDVGVLVTAGAAMVCLAWLVAIVVLPWNLYFRARHLAFELERSRRNGIHVEPHQQVEAAKIQRRMLRISVGLHLASAALLAVGAAVHGKPLGFAFSALFLLSTLFRPGVEYYRFLAARLSDALQEARYPREDVQVLTSQVRQLMSESHAHTRALELARQEHEELARSTRAADAELERRLTTVARTFDDTVSRLTDNQEIISGIKAFLRLVQASPVAPAP